MIRRIVSSVAVAGVLDADKSGPGSWDDPLKRQEAR